MKLQHALGGLENLGPVWTETNPFVQSWEMRIFGIHTVMMAESKHLSEALPKYPIDTMSTTFKSEWTWASLRTGAEDMNPFEYFKFRYYEKWLGGISQFFIDEGYVSAHELAQKTNYYLNDPTAPLPDKPNPSIKQQIVRYLQLGDSGLRPYDKPPLYSLGQQVVVADPPQTDHTRLPGYMRNKVGTIVEVYPGAYGYFVSTGPDGIGPAMPVYRVEFDGEAIWGAGKSEPNTKITADLFEVYIAETA